MTGQRQRWLIAGGLLVAALAVAAAAGWIPDLSARVRGHLDLGPAPGADDPVDAFDTRPHLCRPTDMHRRITWPHPLYRRPRVSSAAYTAVARGGWSWYLNPPSELDVLDGG